MSLIYVLGKKNSGTDKVCLYLLTISKNVQHCVYLDNEKAYKYAKERGGWYIKIERREELRHNNKLEYDDIESQWLDKIKDEEFDFIIHNQREKEEDLEASIHYILYEIQFKNQKGTL